MGAGAVVDSFIGEAGRSASRLPRSTHCFGCSAPPRDPSEAADLATPWLTRDADGTVRAVRYCRTCAPSGQVGEIECAICGDGPLLAENLATGDLLASAAVDEWLISTGWSPAGPWCPLCDPGRRQIRPGAARLA